MDSRRAAPMLGIASSLLVVVLLVIPYLIVDSAAVASYYGAGALTPWAGGLMALVAVIIFAAGREERTDPETAAGAGLGLGFVVFIVSALWAATVPADVPLQLGMAEPLVGPLTTGTVLEYHRWMLAVVAAVPAAAAAWYAKTLRLF
ncbi:MAG: hypothetical protein ACI80F_001659 [Natronomonas sp.]|jgi:hypothetical protein|uniref:DUF7548 family protein n=1 Tax=Natronomonas sp. TaxID=2184060 RepID=UPI0039898FCC